MATSSLYVFIFFCALLAISIDGRKEPGGKYWRNIIHDDALSQTTNEVLNVDVVLPLSLEKEADCDSMDQPYTKNKKFVKDFEPRPNISIYNKDGKLIVEENKSSSSNDFEPRPNISMYGDDANNNGLKHGKKFVDEFEPRPNILIYNEDGKLKVQENKSVTNDFEPRPNISAYGDNDLEEDKKFVDGFEPRPNISIYHD